MSDWPARKMDLCASLKDVWPFAAEGASLHRLRSRAAPSSTAVVGCARERPARAGSRVARVTCRAQAARLGPSQPIERGKMPQSREAGTASGVRGKPCPFRATRDAGRQPVLRSSFESLSPPLSVRREARSARKEGRSLQRLGRWVSSGVAATLQPCNRWPSLALGHAMGRWCVNKP
eukprot:scaffold2131_cov384-Prasinococcus_capsulatus_cf.AAC.12